jgi:RNA polymerase sporulation-specific sigma factor
LNSYVSLNKPIYEQDSDRTLLDVISGGAKVINPEEMIIRREEFTEIKNKMNTILSGLEWEVFLNYLDGKSYQETARELHRHTKSIDNALQRVKRKVEKYKEAHSEDPDIQTVCSCILSIETRKRERKKDSESE